MTKLAEATAAFDVAKLREDFPILAERVHGKPLVYLDNANTTQKPRRCSTRSITITSTTTRTSTARPTC